MGSTAKKADIQEAAQQFIKKYGKNKALESALVIVAQCAKDPDKVTRAQWKELLSSQIEKKDFHFYELLSYCAWKNNSVYLSSLAHRRNESAAVWMSLSSLSVTQQKAIIRADHSIGSALLKHQANIIGQEVRELQRNPDTVSLTRVLLEEDAGFTQRLLQRVDYIIPEISQKRRFSARETMNTMLKNPLIRINQQGIQAYRTWSQKSFLQFFYKMLWYIVGESWYRRFAWTLPVPKETMEAMTIRTSYWFTPSPRYVRSQEPKSPNVESNVKKQAVLKTYEDPQMRTPSLLAMEIGKKNNSPFSMKSQENTEPSLGAPYRMRISPLMTPSQLSREKSPLGTPASPSSSIKSAIGTPLYSIASPLGTPASANSALGTPCSEEKIFKSNPQPTLRNSGVRRDIFLGWREEEKNEEGEHLVSDFLYKLGELEM